MSIIVKGKKGFQATKLCPKGHDKVIIGKDIYPRCRECVNVRNIGRSWKRRGIINKDGSQFTNQDYNREFQIQGGMCKGCGRHQQEFEKKLAADHDHKTNIFRCLLCQNCNLILGLLRDDTTVLNNLIQIVNR